MRFDRTSDARSNQLKQRLRSIPEPPMFDGPLPYIIGGTMVFAASFIVTLMLTEPQQVFEGPSVPRRIERLQQARVFSQAGLAKEAEAVGLFPSNGLRANIDSASRRSDGRAVLTGWAANPANDGSPIVLLVFFKGKSSPVGQTQGAREDVTRALRLPELAARNVAINHVFDCPANNTFLLVAVDEKGGYFALPERYCP